MSEMTALVSSLQERSLNTFLEELLAQTSTSYSKDKYSEDEDIPPSLNNDSVSEDVEAIVISSGKKSRVSCSSKSREKKTGKQKGKKVAVKIQKMRESERSRGKKKGLAKSTEKPSKKCRDRSTSEPSAKKKIKLTARGSAQKDWVGPVVTGRRSDKIPPVCYTYSDDDSFDEVVSVTKEKTKPVKKILKCNECSKLFTDIRRLNCHRRVAHLVTGIDGDDERPYECKECKQVVYFH